jgi:hypothetical protein
VYTVEVVRDTFTDRSTTSKLIIPALPQITGYPKIERVQLELPTHHNGQRNMKKRTCVLPGRYRVVPSDWDKYKCIMPLLAEVPDRTGVFFHPANDPSELEGCLAPAMTRTKDHVEESRRAFLELRDRFVIAWALAHEVYVVIREVGGPGL